jgi:CDP-paratose 2-epimerase
VIHGDIRCASDFESVPDVDWVIDAAALPSVLSGVDGCCSSRQLVEHNLFGTVNMLEYCRRTKAGLVLLSTSRVYSIAVLESLPVTERKGAYILDESHPLPPGVGPSGVRESFSTAGPVSLYGATKLASEALALDYGAAFGFPVWINRCGVLAGAGQFGRPDQGIFSFWLNSWLRKRQLVYCGFGGHGYQVRDCFHPSDLCHLLDRQMNESGATKARVINCSGGRTSSISLRQVSIWCAERWGERAVSCSPATRRFDIPWIVLDTAAAEAEWGWKPTRSTFDILTEIAVHAEANPDWLELSGVE